MKRATSLAVPFALLAITLGAACGGSDSGRDDQQPTQSDAYALENVCTTIPKLLCADRKACCESSAVTFDQAGCETHEKDACDKNVAEVKAGTMTYDKSLAAPCFAKIEALSKACKSDLASFVSLISDLSACTVFAGQKKEGEPCERDDQCAHDATGVSFSSCDRDKHVCRVIRLAGAGEACQLADPIKLCAPGQACNFDLKTYAGSCVPEKALGAACASTDDQTCGLGRYCDGTTCQPGKAAGAAADSGLQCESLKTDMSMPPKCAPSDPLFDATDCSGAP